MLAVVESCGAKTWLFSGQRDQIAKAFDDGDCRFDRFAEQAALVAVALDDYPAFPAPGAVRGMEKTQRFKRVMFLYNWQLVGSFSSSH